MQKILALFLIIFFLPFIFFISILILKNTSYKPFLIQKRIGLEGKTFFIFKLRTLITSTPLLQTEKLNLEQYFIPYGKFLRKYKLDEIPQLFNVILGDMNFVGPRPSLLNQYNLNKLRKKYRINKIKPGITGYAQLSIYSIKSDYFKVKLDKAYLNKRNVILDIKILCRTIYNIFRYH